MHVDSSVLAQVILLQNSAQSDGRTKHSNLLKAP